VVLSVPVQAQTCGSLPPDGYNLPGIVLNLKDSTSGQCFDVWLNELVEISSYLAASSSPSLIMTIVPNNGVFHYNGHNSGYNWVSDMAIFVNGVSGLYVAPSNLDPISDPSTVMTVSIQQVIDNRRNEWAELSGFLDEVDVADIMSVVAKWGLEANVDDGYNSNMDTHFDGVIDVLDVMSVAAAWNQMVTGIPTVAIYSTPGSCPAFHRYDNQVSFTNDSGQHLTFWVEARFGSEWIKDNFVSVPHGAGGLLGHISYERPDEVRLRVADTDMPNISSISWLTSCQYAPPAVTKIIGQPDPFPSHVMNEAAKAGTLFAVTQSQADKMFIVPDVEFAKLNATEAEVEAATGWDVRIVPEYSLDQTARLMFKIPVPCCLMTSAIRFEGSGAMGGMVFASSTMATWIPSTLTMFSLLDRAFPPPVIQNKITEGGPFYVGHDLSGPSMFAINH
jgi:hypothetical protein